MKISRSESRLLFVYKSDANFLFREVSGTTYPLYMHASSSWALQCVRKFINSCNATFEKVRVSQTYDYEIHQLRMEGKCS